MDHKIRQQDLYLNAEMTPSERRAVQRRAKAGDLHRITAGVFTPLPEAEWPALLLREKTRFLAAQFPGTVVGYRTAFDGFQAKDKVFFLTSTYNRGFEYPEMTVALVKGAGPQAGDQPISGRDIYFPSLARILLENLSIDRHPLKRCVAQGDVEARLLMLCQARGEDFINRVREEARALATPLGLEREGAKLDKLISAILGTGTRGILTHPAAKAAANGQAYDGGRIERFDQLVAALRQQVFTPVPAVKLEAEGWRNFAFLESYFSNFIEGTEFEVEEARAIALEGKIVEKRPKDSHDILGVFKQILHPGWRSQVLSPTPSVIEQLQARHAEMMAARPEVDPGQFKDRMNYAGNTAFVAPGLVRGTLAEGARRLADVPPGLARALMAMFLVAEVHPFLDGNGRLARLVMNAELSAAGEARIIVPTLAREEYLDCLRVLTRDGDPDGFIRYMSKLRQWSAGFDYENLDAVVAAMKSCNAFERSRVQFKLLAPPAHTGA
ncbi:MAG: Fic family protein [Rhodocyclaceae bacterium]|nr:Fic family protein [Rhodocyclaceae bacterium]